MIMKKFFLLPVLFFLFLTSGKTQCKKEVLTVIGESSFVAIYNSYCVIGLTADAVFNNVYVDTFARDIANEQIRYIQVLKEEIRLSAEADAYDIDWELYMYDAIACFEKISEAAEALVLYIANKNTSNYDFFQVKREAAWDSIDQLFFAEEE
jgi:hypothetical protein